MIGNDVVDLALAARESTISRKGFLDKLFILEEQLFIKTSEDKTLTIWTMWSQKEAVYKILRQKGASRGFYPKKIECISIEKVRYQNEVYYTKTITEGTCLHTLAVTKKADFKNCISLPCSAPLIYKREIPFFNDNGKLAPATKSHHGELEFIFFLKNLSNFQPAF